MILFENKGKQKMKEFKILPRSILFELFTNFNKENRSNDKAIAVREIDISSLERLRNLSSIKPTYTSFVAKGIALVLKEMPHFNLSTIETIFYKRQYQFLNTHVSVAVERNDIDEGGGAAFVYTIYDVDKKSLIAITQEIMGLSDLGFEENDKRLDRWRKIKNAAQYVPFTWIISLVVFFQKNIPSLYIKNRGGAVMISSPCKYGVDFIVAHWPYTYGLSFGLAKERPWVENGLLCVRKTMPMTLSFDRRLISGANAAKLMTRLCEILENAEKHFIQPE